MLIHERGASTRALLHTAHPTSASKATAAAVAREEGGGGIRRILGQSICGFVELPLSALRGTKRWGWRSAVAIRGSWRWGERIGPRRRRRRRSRRWCHRCEGGGTSAVGGGRRRRRVGSASAVG